MQDYFPPMTKAQLATAYGVHPNTFRRWMKRINLDTGKAKFLYSDQVKYIVEKIGMPDWRRLE